MSVKCLGYLSAAPRVSTRLEAELAGPRVHVTGVIDAFQTLGWQVKPYIVGDRVPVEWIAKGSEKAVNSSFLRALVADLVRLVMGVTNAYRASQKLGQVHWVYERLATLQSLGWIFKRRGIPWILETNALLFYEAEVERKTSVLSQLAYWMEMRAYRHADVIVCISEALKEAVVHTAQVSPSKVIVIPNGVDTDLVTPSRYLPKRLFENFTVGFIGGLYAWQGLDLLLHSIAALKEIDLDISLVVVGDGPMREDWEQLTQTLRLEKKVRFLGQLSRTDLLPIIQGFDVGYSGHFDLEGKRAYRSPLKLYEYMAMATPVIASAVEDSKMLIREGETGFLFEPGNLDELKQALIVAYKFREQLDEMGKLARIEIENHHSWVARVKAIISKTEQILSAKE